MHLPRLSIDSSLPNLSASLFSSSQFRGVFFSLSYMYHQSVLQASRYCWSLIWFTDCQFPPPSPTLQSPRPNWDANVSPGSWVLLLSLGEGPWPSRAGPCAKKDPLPGILHLCEGKMMMMYETALPLELEEDMTVRIIWEENTVLLMETDGLSLSSRYC